MNQSTMNELTELNRLVNEHMLWHYRIPLPEMEITDVPGYWQDKTARVHKNHPLHRCVGCSGAFKATYTYYDRGRNNGRFSSRYETWRKIKAAKTT